MKYVILPCEEQTAVRRLSFYLAMEEYVARSILPPLSPADSSLQAGEQTDSFFLWQVKPSVIFGRNQVMQNEVNTDYCRKYGIAMYRRKSGGGCVYADEGNVMLSFVTRSENVPYTFNRFIGMLLLVLRRLGIDAVSTSHNDILVNGRKVSGTAFYHLPGCSIVHATLLYDTNMQHMLSAITPPAEKLQAKGIESVRQRITLLKDYVSMSLDELKAFIRQTLCNGELPLTEADVSAIEQLEQEYLRREFIQKL